ALASAATNTATTARGTGPRPRRSRFHHRHGRLAHQPGERLEHRDDHGEDRDRQADQQDAEPDLATRLVARNPPGPRAVDRALAQLIAPASLERHLLLERQLDLSHALSH